MCGRFDGLLLKVPNQDLNDEVASLLSADKSYFIALHDDEFLFSDCEYCSSMFLFVALSSCYTKRFLHQ